MKFRWWMLGLLLALAGCSSKADRLNEQIDLALVQVDQSMTALQRALDTGALINATLLQQYGKQLAKDKPEFASLANSLADNATTQGALYQGLSQRLDEVKKNRGSDTTTLDASLTELMLIAEGLQLTTFNDALSDPVNVLADLSQGKLARVQSVSRDTEAKLNNSGEYGTGSQLIGNPHYGQWRTGSNGLSFWEWYGVYALFSDLGGGRRHYYRDWSYRRPYSYYHDYGRTRYTSRSQYRSQNTVQTRTEKSFQQQGKRFNSPYAKQRGGSSKLAKTSQSRPASGSFRKASTYRNSSSSSSRRSSSRTGRGPRRGK